MALSHRVFYFLCLVANATFGGWALAEAPYVDSKAIAERFDSITSTDMEELRTKKILLASRSFGLNLVKGLGALAKQDSKYDLLASYQRYDVFRAGGDLTIIPGNAFTDVNFVHFLATYWPHTQRLEETDRLLREAPHEFGGSTDAVIVYFHTASPALTESYIDRLESWQAAFPKVRFIAVTAGFMGPKFAKENAASAAFGEEIRERLKGRIPLYDLGAILSGDFRDGNVFLPEYSADPAEVHPNLTAGEVMMAKGFLLILKEAFAQGSVVSAGKGEPIAVVKKETLSSDHPDAQAVRAILDANGLTAKTVEGVSVVESGRIVELFLQEGGVSELPDAVGQLTALRKLHLYGDRSLDLPLLHTVSPALARCTGLEELLLNQNNLVSLPPEIATLKNIRMLSIAENHLTDLAPVVLAWVKRFDPQGLSSQKP